MRLQFILIEQLTYIAICKLRIACYDILVDSKLPLTYSAICNLGMACYDIVLDFEWTVDLFYDL